MYSKGIAGSKHLVPGTEIAKTSKGNLYPLDEITKSRSKRNGKMTHLRPANLPTSAVRRTTAALKLFFSHFLKRLFCRNAPNRCLKAMHTCRKHRSAESRSRFGASLSWCRKTVSPHCSLSQLELKMETSDENIRWKQWRTRLTWSKN